MLELAYGAGLRVSEWISLGVRDVMLQDHLVRVFGKGAKERVVPIGSFAREAVDGYLVRARPGLAAAGRGQPALFLNARGGRLSRRRWPARRRRRPGSVPGRRSQGSPPTRSRSRKE